jgi:hypothetical protein
MTEKTEQQDEELSTSENENLPKPHYSKKRITSVLLTLSLALAMVFALMVVFPRITNPPVQQMTSLDWSGYCVASDLIAPQPWVTGVSASWTVPAVSVSVGDSYSAAWIGVGGQYDNTLIHVGTEQDSINGRATFSAWYELLPRRSVTIDSVSISSGDKITASISLSDRATNMWLIEIYDATTGQSFKKSLVYASSMLSADWIVEVPTVANRNEALANFGQITFKDCRATVGNETGTINSFPSDRITLNSHQNITLATVSAFTYEESSFTVSYGYR